MPLAMLIRAWLEATDTVQPKNGPQPKEPNAISYANRSMAKACNKVQPERRPFKPLKKATGHHGQMSKRCPRICPLKSHKEPYRVA